MTTPIILFSLCLVSVGFTFLLVSACVLAGRLDKVQLEGYEEH
jgi:hypothetical protein